MRDRRTHKASLNRRQSFLNRVPSKIWGGERYSSVDSALSLLFNTAPWGREPIGISAQSYSAVTNPYYDWSASCPNRSKPADFGKFRDSGACNKTTSSTSGHNPCGFPDKEEVQTGYDTFC